MAGVIIDRTTENNLRLSGSQLSLRLTFFPSLFWERRRSRVLPLRRFGAFFLVIVVGYSPPRHNTHSPLRNTPTTPAPFTTTTMATADAQVRPPCARAAAVSPAVRLLTDNSVP